MVDFRKRLDAAGIGKLRWLARNHELEIWGTVVGHVFLFYTWQISLERLISKLSVAAGRVVVSRAGRSKRGVMSSWAGSDNVLRPFPEKIVEKVSLYDIIQVHVSDQTKFF